MNTSIMLGLVLLLAAWVAKGDVRYGRSSIMALTFFAGFNLGLGLYAAVLS